MASWQPPAQDAAVDDAVIARVRKLFAMANDKRGNENEAANAAAMAQKIITDYGLELAQLETQADVPGGVRDKKQHDRAAMYQYQQFLMGIVAECNFCRHFITTERALSFGKTRTVKRHVLVGRSINVRAATMIYDYLIETMDRLLPWQGMEKRGRDALLWLDGCATRLGERLVAQRKQQLAEEQRAKEEREVRAKHPGAASSGTALMLVDVYSSEEDYNEDYIRGLQPGTTARLRRERAASVAAWEAEYRRQQDAYDAKAAQLVADGCDKREAWYKVRGLAVPQPALPSPVVKARKPKPESDAARARRESAQERYQERQDRKRSKAEAKFYHPSYQAGRRTGEEIGLNDQVGNETKRRLV